MKYYIHLLLLFCSLSFAQSRNGNDQPLNNGYFDLKYIAIRLQNNFILDNSEVKKRAIDKVPIEYDLTVIGENINLKLVNSQRGDTEIREGQFVYSNLDAIEDLYKMENLEIQILKNNKIVKNWAFVTKSKKYNDTIFSVYYKKTYNEMGYFFYSDSLVKGDIIDLLFRKKGQEISLKLHIQKKESARKPFIINKISNDFKKQLSFEDFINNSMDELAKVKLTDESKFYDDWPENYDTSSGGNLKTYSKGENFCLVFRKPSKKKRTDNSFEYRTSINSKSGEWKKSNGFIFMYLKEPGTEYMLEVRYKVNPQYVATYKWFTEAEWYQTIWFKITVGIFCLLIIAIVFIFWFRIKEKRKQAQQKMKLKTLYAQLNPHFLFNALGSIQGLLNDNQIEKANQYLIGFATLLRNILNSSENETDSLANEIKSINNYMELEQLRKPFVYVFSIDETISPYEVEIIPLLIQPLIENAVKHGISNKENAKISIRIFKKDSDLIFEISDNGKGFDILAQNKGFGLKLVKDRISLFNQSSKMKKIDMKILSDSFGTKVTIYYKNWLKND